MSPASIPPQVSVIVPTFHEAENIGELAARIGRVRTDALNHLELLIVDDDSRDGTEALVERLNLSWVRLLIRRNRRGLSTAVLEGIREARGEIFVVMDADLSHPPERIPDLIAQLGGGADFVLGSRYVAGGSTDARWGAWRWLNSKAATLLARPLTRVSDPMSGFFALRRSTFESAAPLNPLGYKIGLELMVKCSCKRIVEVPIAFTERTRGRSKLSMRQQVLYLRHISRLLRFKWLG